MYNVDLKVKIDRGADCAPKMLRKRPFRANLTFSNSTILQIWGPSNYTIFENFRSPPLLASLMGM